MTQTIDYSASSLDDAALDAEFGAALIRARGLTNPVEHLVDGKIQASGELTELPDPTGIAWVSRRAYVADSKLVTEAVSAARAAGPAWRALGHAERCRLLRQAQSRFKVRSSELAALISAETGKPRLASFAEVAEAADLIAYYSHELDVNNGYYVELDSTDTESRSSVLRPYGVFGIIAPFNFPVALAVSMSAAALLTGNTVVVKPSDKTPRTTTTALRWIAEGLPDGVVNVIQGGAATGQLLAASEVDAMAFTGSSEVGWGLVEAMKSGPYPRPVVAEMGGQNPAIVTARADLDLAAAGIAKSAFAMSGQVCSACRRVVVAAEVADELVRRLQGRAEALLVGDPSDPQSDLGPVIDDRIAARIEAAVDTAARDGVVVTGGRLDRDGYFFSPTIVRDLPAGHPLTREELFAPFVSVTAVDGFDAAITEANAVNYGLSAGIFSDDEREVGLFLDRIEAGVVYVNRASGATTGAWPGRQTFCGWKRSGSSGKGGLGPWYLPSFMREQSRTIVVR